MDVEFVMKKLNAENIVNIALLNYIKRIEMVPSIQIEENAIIDLHKGKGKLFYDSYKEMLYRGYEIFSECKSLIDKTENIQDLNNILEFIIGLESQMKDVELSEYFNGLKELLGSSLKL